MQVTLNNSTTNLANANIDLTPLGPALAMFTSARLFLGGQVVEQIDELGPLATIIEKTKPHARQLIDSMQTHPFNDAGTATVVPAGGSRRLLFELPFGMFNSSQTRWLPWHILSQLVVEMTLAQATQAFLETRANF